MLFGEEKHFELGIYLESIGEGPDQGQRIVPIRDHASPKKENVVLPDLRDPAPDDAFSALFLGLVLRDPERDDTDEILQRGRQIKDFRVDPVQAQKRPDEQVFLPLAGAQKMIGMEDLVVENPQVVQVDEFAVFEARDLPFMDEQVLQSERHVHIADKVGGQIFQEGKLREDIPLEKDNPTLFGQGPNQGGILGRIELQGEGEISKKAAAFVAIGMIGDRQDDLEMSREAFGELPGPDPGTGHHLAGDVVADQENVIH